MLKKIAGVFGALAMALGILSVASPAQAAYDSSNTRPGNYFDVREVGTIFQGDTLVMKGRVGNGVQGGRVTLQLKAAGSQSSGNWMTMKVFSVGSSGKFKVTQTASVTGTWRVVFRRYATTASTDVASNADYVCVYRSVEGYPYEKLALWS